MAVTQRTKIIVWSKAGGCCSMPDCRQELIRPGDDEEEALVGEVAHIVAQQSEGPRGNPSGEVPDVDAEPNLMLLCPTHHTEVDKNPATYTVERLQQLKADHERWVRESLRQRGHVRAIDQVQDWVDDTLHSTLLPVVGYPKYVYAGDCVVDQKSIRESMDPPSRGIMLPYIVRSRQLISFTDLRSTDSPFRKVVDRGTVERHNSEEWWANDDLRNWYVTLLNRAINKHTGRRGLMLDKDHHRYYFTPEDGPEPREVVYSTLNGQRRPKKVAWQPILKHSGEPRNYWQHLAVGLGFHNVGPRSWVFSIRPEHRFTRDGYKPLTPKGIGRRSTSKKSRMYNEQVLREVHFWRDFLSLGKPRIVFDFGEQKLMIDTQLLGAEVSWPGVQGDETSFSNQSFQEDLFSVAELEDFEEYEEEGDEWLE